MSRDEIQKAKQGLEIELRGQQAKGQSLLKDLEACKCRILELRASIATFATVLDGDGHAASNGHVDDKQLAGAPD